MKFRKGTNVKHIDAERHGSDYGTVMIARHTQDKYTVRWSVTYKGQTRFWIQEHSRLVLIPA